jgi:hypothetical protein
MKRAVPNKLDIYVFILLVLDFEIRDRWLGYGVQHHLQQYFSYIVAVSFIGGGNLNTHRKPPTCRKSLINSSVDRH